MKKDKGPTLFDIIEQETIKENPSSCIDFHKGQSNMRPTITVWSHVKDPRLTMTCMTCGYVRGRWPKEWSLREK